MFADLTTAQKEELATSLAVLAIFDAEGEVSAENIQAALKASNNKVAAYVPQLFADSIARGIAVEKLLAGPSAGSAPAAAAGGSAAPAEAKKEEEKEEEEEADLGGGMDMFGDDEDY